MTISTENEEKETPQRILFLLAQAPDVTIDIKEKIGNQELIDPNVATSYETYIEEKSKSFSASTVETL